MSVFDAGRLKGQEEMRAEIERLRADHVVVIDKAAATVVALHEDNERLRAALKQIWNPHGGWIGHPHTKKGMRDVARRALEDK